MRIILSIDPPLTDRGRLVLLHTTTRVKGQLSSFDLPSLRRARGLGYVKFSSAGWR